VTGQQVEFKDSAKDVAEEWDAPSGTSSAPIAKCLYRLCAPLRWWKRSTARIVVSEIYTLPHRISATRDLWSLSNRSPVGERVYLAVHERENPETESRFLDAYIEGMELLLGKDQWFGAVEIEIYDRAFRAGAQFLLDSSGTRSSNEQSA
jgi:hypothetical protein